MKTILKLSLLLCLVPLAYGQSPLTPSILMGGMVSAGGTGAPGSWSPLTGTGGTVVAGTPHTLAGLLYSTDGTGHPGTWAYWTGTSSGGGAIGAAGAIQTASGTGGGFADGGCTAVSGTITCAGTGPSQLGLTYNATPLVPGSATTAVYGVNSSGQAVISEAAGAASRVCTAGNGACPGSVTSSTLTTNRLPKASGAAALTDSLQTDNGTTLTYTGTGGSVTPGLATNATGNAFFGMAASGTTLTPNSYTNVDTSIGRSAAGIVRASAGTQNDGLGSYQAAAYLTTANCSSSASPAVCAAAAAGSVTVAAAATTVVVNTSAVTANSQIFLTFDSSLGTKLGVTCNTSPSMSSVSARSTGVSFTISTAAPSVNPDCFSYLIVN